MKPAVRVFISNVQKELELERAAVAGLISTDPFLLQALRTRAVREGAAAATAFQQALPPGTEELSGVCADDR